MDWSFRRGGGGPSGPSLAGSVLFHVGVFALAVLATRRAPEPLTFITYEVEIVSPPPAPAQEVADTPAPEDELVVERPDPEPEPEPETAVPEPEAEPEPAEPEPESETTPEEEETEPEPEPEAEAATTEAEPEEEAEVSGEDLEVRMEGLRRDFPAYYGNIIRQIRRCFRPPSGLPGGLRTTVYFVIRQDGTVDDLRFVEQSGNPDFDYEALGAVGDCASGRFGSLPDELPYERLPIQFTFRPSG